MTPVFQTRTGYPNGNCWEACLATLLDIPLESVPDGRPEGERMDRATEDRWLRERFGRVLCWIDFKLLTGCWVPTPYYLLGGTTKSGLAHVVVAKGGEVVHNPNPDPEAELASVDGAFILVPVAEGPSLPVQQMPSPEEMAAIMEAR